MICDSYFTSHIDQGYLLALLFESTKSISVVFFLTCVFNPINNLTKKGNRKIIDKGSNNNEGAISPPFF